jgi:1-acyl-sn-glycerol-3-phosphate acyltransferase
MSLPAVRRILDRSTSQPAPYNGLWSELVRWFSLSLLKTGGWKLQGDWPGLDKVVLIAAPHTSLWDGWNMLLTAGAYRVKLRWMGKKSLGQGPFGWIVKRTGLVPVDRSASHDMVGQMKRAFEAEPRMVLAVAPEGKRELTPQWKRGFYHIAHGAGVPMVLSVLNYGDRTISLSGVIEACGDFDSDFAWIAQHYKGVGAKHPEKFVVGA